LSVKYAEPIKNLIGMGTVVTPEPGTDMGE